MKYFQVLIIIELLIYTSHRGLFINSDYTWNTGMYKIMYTFIKVK